MVEAPSGKKPLYRPYRYFLPFHQRDKRFAFLLVHRGGGKTIASVNELIEQASYASPKANARYAYIAPFLNQAKGIAWDYLKMYSEHCRTEKPNETELSVTLVNGAKIFILGADKPDSLRGKHWNGVVIDEVAQIKRSVYTEIITPALARRKGWIALIGTPKGKGNIFYEKYLEAQSNPDKWFLLELSVKDTNIIGPEELKDWEESVDEAEFRQEALCSFEAALVGSYYGKHIEELTNQGKIVSQNLYSPHHKVSVAMDIGYNDATAAWFWQVVKGEVRMIDYWEFSGKDAEEVCIELKKEPYEYELIWLPHDAKHKTFQSRKSVIDTFIEYFGPIVRQVSDPDGNRRVFHGIDISRKVLRKFPLRFGYGTEKGIECLKNYSRAWNEKFAQFNDAPKHDHWSHGADAFRYFATVIQWEDIKRSIDRDEPEIPLLQGNLINIQWTLNDALRAQQRQLSMQRNQGRKRI
jgi:hypothetical protein